MYQPRIYLAGPDVFRPNCVQVFKDLKAVCHRHGARGVSPLDGVISVSHTPVGGMGIFEANKGLICGADAVVANLTPFRGPSADVGTVWELGYAYALGKPVTGYSSCSGLYQERFDGSLEDSNGWVVEQFQLPDNLMICGSLVEVGGNVASFYKDFEQALVRVLDIYRDRTRQDGPTIRRPFWLQD